MPNPLRNAPGDKYHRLTIISRVPAKGNTRWLCRCDCGNQVEVASRHLRSGRTKSCGCLNREQIAAVNKTHGMFGTKTYTTWASMIQRCTNPKAKQFEDWGGRGITVCERWRSFENFLADMGEKPEGMTLERIDVNGNYEPGNCKWATWQEQRLNRRDTP